MAEQRGALEILFPGVKVGKHEVKPWTFKQAKILMPAVSRVVATIRKWYVEKGGSAEDLSPTKLDEAMRKFPPEKILGELLPSLFDEVGEVLSVSLGMSLDEIDAMEFGDASTLFLAILVENMEYLKNLFGPASAEEIQ